MQNAKTAGVRHEPLLAYRLRSLRNDRSGNGGEIKKKKRRQFISRWPEPRIPHHDSVWAFLCFCADRHVMAN